MEPVSYNESKYFVSFFNKESRALEEAATQLMDAMFKGHICISITDELTHQVLRCRPRFVTVHPSDPRPFIIQKDKLYIFRNYQYETSIIEKIQELVTVEEAAWQARIEFLNSSSAFANLKKQAERDTVDWQLIASAVSFLQNFSIITGGPGTGKTTTLVKVLNLILEEKPDAIIKLAAPTGKAAARMEEAIRGKLTYGDNADNLGASTIHRLLGSKNLSPYFKHNKENPIEADILIVDEASMIDVALFAKLLDAIGKNTRLVLLGDQNQLASVDAGSLFGDLCKSVAYQNQFSGSVKNALQQLEMVQSDTKTEQKPATVLQNHLTSLKKSYRFKEDEAISVLSKAVIAGNTDKVMAVLEELPPDSPVEWETELAPELLKTFVKGFEAYIECTDTKEALDLFNKQRILCAIRKGKYGVAQINSEVETLLHNKKCIKLNGTFYENRPVMVTKNYHDLRLYNGDIGLVRTVDGEKRIWFLDKNDELRGVSPGYLADVETNFAMTIHKSQGSEFERVMLVLPGNDEVEILTRELLYTGITRAKSSLLLVGSKEVLTQTVERKVHRMSGISERLV